MTSSGSLLQFWLPAPVLPASTQEPCPSILPLRFGTAHGLIPPLLGSLSQENYPGQRGIQDEPVLGQAVLTILGESAQDRSPRTDGSAISQFWHPAPILIPL